MRAYDGLSFCARSLYDQKLRAALSAFGIAIGIASVILVASLGSGARRFLVGEFTQFGTNVLGVNPGKTETLGIPGVLGGSTKKLTVEDAEALKKIPGVQTVLPVCMGLGRVEGAGRGRSVHVLGVTSEATTVFKVRVRQGLFIPSQSTGTGRAVAVLGPKLKTELFGSQNALGQFVRISGQRLRVIGVMEPKGQLLGFDMDDIAYVPLHASMRLFNLRELMEIDLTFSHAGMQSRVVRDVTRILKERHGGRVDFTITTQDAILSVLNRILTVVTGAVSAIASISLLVGAVGILTVMWITSQERTSEVGLLRALGATRAQVRGLFLLDAALIATLGGLVGTGCAFSVSILLRVLVPGLQMHTPSVVVVSSICVSVLVGLVAGILPAIRASNVPPVRALGAE